MVPGLRNQNLHFTDGELKFSGARQTHAASQTVSGKTKNSVLLKPGLPWTAGKDVHCTPLRDATHVISNVNGGPTYLACQKSTF
jgi:hypothetical protein